MASAWETTGQKFGEALESGTQASITGINRQWAQKLYEVKKRDRDRMFEMVTQAVTLGSNVLSNVRQNREAIKFAESKGLKTNQGNWVNKAFGKPSFYGSKNTYTMEDVLAREAFDIDFTDPTYEWQTKEKKKKRGLMKDPEFQVREDEFDLGAIE